ncbi:methylated-DNA--[protein]-cysteine S-methyltransferase [Domibacillus epiphyticus]|uniref:Methylated-DNA--protein-cysteine methyltransferase n=1 Tax=Domibacillus epiphyticus TaxID=1714355 RepID=A0A1V2A5B9_9BACI|nr:methylated-DNA--[protein]-cysteine S-methyltransferase [Domibacillus epiphyticus]OMP66198.1 cysteine methyltransferase [Domibacillus epiphyticus]
MKFVKLDSPIGPLSIVRSEKGICSVNFYHMIESTELTLDEQDALLQKAAVQLSQYFNRERHVFDLTLDIKGTLFQENVWRALCSIPFGKTVSYQEIAVMCGNHKAVRAVGQANKRNPVPIIIPCHRVIGKNKSMTGYSGKEIDKKMRLLQLEGAL